MARFRLFPKSQEEWGGAFLFIFRAYVVVSLVVDWFLSTFWVHGKTTGSEMKNALMALYDFEERVMVGYAVCLIVLGVIGLEELIKGRWRSALINLFLAAISLWVIFTADFAMS